MGRREAGQPSCMLWAHTTTLHRNFEWDLTMLAWIYLVVAAGGVVLAGGTLACPLECQCNGPTVACSNASLTTIPSGIPATVTTLDLSYSRITLNTSGIFSNFTGLIELKLGWNSISTIDSGSFQGLTNLRSLLLQGNMLQTLSQDVFVDLRSLKVLDLSQNDIKDATSGQFAQLSELTSLNLTGNRLQTLPADILQPLPNLTFLSLSGNPWSCDCNSQWVITWINQQDANSSLQFDSPSCDEPAGLQGTLLSSLESHNLTCIPPTIYNTSDLHINTSMYSTVNLPCQARGLPLPTIYWRLSDGRTVPVPHTWTDGDTRFNIGRDGSLRIVNITTNIGGHFVCGANNSVGSDQVTYRVNVIVPTTTTAVTTTSMPTVRPTNSTPVPQNTTQEPPTTPKQTTQKVLTTPAAVTPTQSPPSTTKPVLKTTTGIPTTSTTTKSNPLANIPWDQFRRDQLGAGLGIPLILLAIGGGVAAWYFMKKKRRKDAARKAEAQDGGYIVANPMALQMDKVEPNGNTANGNNVPEIPVDATVIENPSIIETPNGTLVFIPEENKSYRESKLI
ncbi:PREDICTED: immunoglobulin superfamily member 10-like [Branchiostoma belcheri]|uniref:Immunoglobulin superfamily member 10-like n=1 Tax=Branchiostoma belcheri TaxID=7741 RepID=A0A6P4YZ51_BRABE|nr:PREDICTED: immunoglobulin superfamily member 10-like [Branchiostoma belcheri]XP_019626974.1 PREDICTED: immunoglobulin superfamily member 10-like [Branchiostoma belcheri]XP_019626975.1 PREDICTED: immunoglobulin superfamily member 10-like [Branchiostoma belcheri]XP_019626976.1 PREDICTED: immunoglobulin superfamily member 10-like [Branchiostoma belcheri]XP_019626977.1 PREDICTED: immunoglobulin superfamily member 10-like [Branchiostoma belcheri]XP_019626978.1 PREDICTED: immunoglobulin superfami